LHSGQVNTQVVFNTVAGKQQQQQQQQQQQHNCVATQLNNNNNNTPSRHVNKYCFVIVPPTL